jgi:hypothetical protein
MSDLAWIGDRIPGDPRFVRLIGAGRVAMPAPTTPSAKWEAKQAALFANNPVRARLLVTILDQIAETIGPQMAARSLLELRQSLAEIAAEGGDDE